MIAIIDYGAGNTKSLQIALDKLNMPSILTADPIQLKEAEAIILPGVGAFKDAMDILKQSDLAAAINEAAAGGKPILGICLGMQLFYEKSFENGEWEGLGLLKGTVSRIPNTVKVPHMGWNTLIKHLDRPICKGVDSNAYVYFVHSYFLSSSYDKNTVVASSHYGEPIPAIVQRENIIGMQFHPEKSGVTGMQLLKNFREMIE